LRAAFSVGPDSSITAQQLFTDRIAEVAAFDSSLAQLRDHLAQATISPVADQRMPRKNVLTYYGVGGIGKTRLSHELANRFTAAGKEPDIKRAVARFDFAEAASFDIESYVLRLRAAFGHLGSRWHAFDIAFAIYWERAHPGEPIRDFISKDSVLRRAANAIGLADQVTSAVVEVLGMAFPGVTQVAEALGRLAWSKARKAITTHRALSNCELLGTLLDADADLETLSYFPYLLAWEMERASSAGPNAVVFLDTFEEVTARSTRETECWLQRSVHLMPNVLFVVTGRNRLDWADDVDIHDLDYTGLRCWPNLQRGYTESEPRQHLVGFLSEQDADSYLSGSLTTGSQPTIPGTIRERIVQAGGGLPLYLDLAVTMYLDLITQGRTPVPDDFGQPLPAVAARILRDLDSDERDLLRVSALVGAFDMDLLKTAYPDVRDSTLLRFGNRTFLEHDADRYWPYSLHSLLRSAIRGADTGLSDSWSIRERDEAAARVGTYLQKLAASAVQSGDRSTQVAAVRKAVDLCLDTSQLFGWLIEAVQDLLVAGGWTALANLPTGQEGSVLSAVILGLHGARERRSGRLDDAVQMMDRALSVPQLPAELRRFLVLHRAHALRVAGRYSEGADGYQELLREPDGSFANDARYWLGDYTFLQGQFREVLDSMRSMSPDPAELYGEVLRLRGHVYRVNALFHRAEASYREALDLARRTSNAAAEGKALTDLMQTLAWRRPEDALQVREQALQVNETLSNMVEIVKIRAASAVAFTQAGRFDEAVPEIERGLALTNECAYPGGQVWCWVARVLHRLKTGDEPGAVEAAREVSTITDRLQGNRFWSEIAGWWTQTGDGHVNANVDWLGGRAAARSRWLEVYAGSAAGPVGRS
jgi:tetratricopeptide (TPR) repeat protein